MINNLEELYEKTSSEELIDLFVECSSKNKSEIIGFLKEKGYEISDDFASEILKCYDSIIPIDDSDLAYASGGSEGSGCLPASARNRLEIAIKGLNKYKQGISSEIVKEIVQSIIDDLNSLLAKPYDKIPFNKELSRIEIRVAFLPHGNNGKDMALRNIAEAQRITSRES